MKSFVIKTAAIAALSALAVPSFACTQNDPGCNNATVNFGSSYQLDPNHTGIYLQNNSGTNTAISNLKHVIIYEGGDVNVNTTAVGNSFQVDLSGANSAMDFKHINQNNTGDQTAITSLGIWDTGHVGDVTLNTTAVGNSVNLSAADTSTSLSDLSVNQCNTGDITAVTNFYRDPKSLTVSTSAIGNAVNISVK